MTQSDIPTVFKITTLPTHVYRKSFYTAIAASDDMHRFLNSSKSSNVPRFAMYLHKHESGKDKVNEKIILLRWIFVSNSQKINNFNEVYAHAQTSMTIEERFIGR